MLFMFLAFFSSILMLLYLFWVGRLKPLKKIETPEQPTGKEMKPYLYLKAFYINDNDPRGWLPKVNPLFGTTVNFRKKSYAHVFILLLASTVLFTFLYLGLFAF